MVNARIILFQLDKKSLFSWLICLVTGSKWTHSAIQVNNRVYEASESKGCIATRGKIGTYGKRVIRVYDCEVNDTRAEMWVQKHLGKRYDYVGIFGWLWNVHSRDHFYCFEFTWDFMKIFVLQNPEIPKHLSAKTIINALRKPNYEGPSYLWGIE